MASARSATWSLWYCGQSDAAALYFDVLALFPDCEEAKEGLLHPTQKIVADFLLHRCDLSKCLLQ